MDNKNWNNVKQSNAMSSLILQINKAILKYKNNYYTENEFQNSMESISSTITENELYEFKSLLRNLDYELETINFMTDKDLRREEYLLQINKVEHYLNQFNDIKQFL